MTKFLFLSLILAFSSVAANTTDDAPVLSFDAVEDFLNDATPRQVSFELSGIVESSSSRTASPTDKGHIILADPTTGLRTELHMKAGGTVPEAGDTIKARGTLFMGKQHEPLLQVEQFDVLAKGSRPEPVRVKLSAISAAQHNLMTIRTEGTVIDVLPDEADRRYQIVILKDDNRTLLMPVPLAPFGDQSKLIDARIRVTGIFRRSVSGVRKFSPPNLQPQTPKDIEVLTPPPDDPFAAPPLEKRLYLSSEEIARMSKRATVGRVLATWAGNQAMLRESDGRIVNLTFANGMTLPPCGTTIKTAGHPETDLFRINLSAARWKAVASADDVENETAEPCTPATFWRDDTRNILNDEAHGKLLSVRGETRTLPLSGSKDPQFILDAGAFSVSVDMSSAADQIDQIEIGCQLQVTGRCLLLADASRPSRELPQAQGFVLVVRSPADIQVLSRPPWWTPLRLTVVISLLIAALVAIYIWNRVLQKLVTRRGRELYREQVAHAIAEFKTDERTRLAVELHDSLSQSLAGVACHIEAGTNTLQADPNVARRFFDTANKMLDSCRTELRYCLFDLRNDTLEEPDFPTAIRKSLDQLDSNATFDIRFDIPRKLLKDTVAHAILAIVRELTGNAIRHGGASEVQIEGHVTDGQIRITVCDNGKGFDPDCFNGPLQGHFGLEGIRNRLEKLEGSFSIESRPNEGAKATVTLPLPDNGKVKG